MLILGSNMYDIVMSVVSYIWTLNNRTEETTVAVEGPLSNFNGTIHNTNRDKSETS